MIKMEGDKLIEVSMNVPFPSPREASIACEVLRVDSEPRRSGVSKVITVEENNLKVRLSSKEARQLRVAVHSFIDYLVLAAETMEHFGPPRSQDYCVKMPSSIKTVCSYCTVEALYVWIIAPFCFQGIAEKCVNPGFCWGVANKWFQMSEHSPAPTPSRAVYGFAFHLASCTGFALYMLWGFALPLLPHSVSSLPFISQLPQPYWALAIPIHACMALATFAFFIYPGINLVMTPPSDDMRVIRDTHSHPPLLSAHPAGGIPPVGDLDISDVCRILYIK